MKMVLLVAGQGKRLRPYTNDKPKCKVELGKESLIDRQLRTIKESGISNSDLIFITGFKSELIKSIDNAKYIHNHVFDKTNLVYSYFHALEALRDEDEIVISYGDLIYDQSVLDKLLDSNEDISVVLDSQWEEYWESKMDNPLDDAKSLKLDSEGYIKEIGKKANDISEIQGQYIGLTKFKKDGVKKLHNYLKELFNVETPTNDLDLVENSGYYMQQLLNDLVNRGENVAPVFIDGDFIEIDTAKEYEEISDVFDSSKSVKENRELLYKVVRK